MAEIIRNRTIRPSTRLESSKSYKIDTKKVSNNDILIVNINHESKSFHETFKFNGKDVAQKSSISFRVKYLGTQIVISWSGAIPIGRTAPQMPPSTKKSHTSNKVSKSASNTLKFDKTSFAPISNTETEILILGTMPGDKSIELGEYYGHTGNRFWKIVSTITNNELPSTYSDKKELLIRTKIGVWDVAHKVNRKGSLDSAIKNEEPNDLDDFIEKHKNLKVIGFNGTKSKALFNKYFEKKNGIKYILLPSTSSANTHIDFENICIQWREILSEK